MRKLYGTHFGSAYRKHSPSSLLTALPVTEDGWGFGLMYVPHTILDVYYFTIALMKHNAKNYLDIIKLNIICNLGG